MGTIQLIIVISYVLYLQRKRNSDLKKPTILNI